MISMDGMERFFDVLHYLTDSKRKRHIIGGSLLSISMLFGGLAITIITIKDKENEQ